MTKFLKAALTGAAILCGANLANAATIGGVEFPDGDRSFADSVYDSYRGDNVADDYWNPSAATGVPDWSATSQANAVSLGQGGWIILEFTDNSLMASGDSNPDLHIFEVGAATEPMYLSISANGIDWLALGSSVFQGQPSSIDIDQYMGSLDLETKFRFVRIESDPASPWGAYPWAGADIDAVGAISSGPAPVPLPAAGWLLLAGIGGLGLMRRRG